ncbi:L-fucose/L-arabinose isomerase family protein [Georgenia alba]|uniref:L-fucose/L-arabinose isomerase family protein n=1 Tax=Georgenia alba TaxID=2233858 RepID=A0ABW2Q594_9MICO
MRVAVIPTARPTFVVDVARARADAARDALRTLGADVVGPEELVMTPEDVENAATHLGAEVDLVVNVCASFSDASPALRLYTGLDRPVLLWAFREPGPVGDRLWLNSMCGANLFGHALRRAGAEVRLVYGDPDEPEVRQVLARALRDELAPAPALPTGRRERADARAVRAALDTLRGRSIGTVGDAPPGFTPSEYDPEVLDRLFGLRVEPITIEETFDRVRDVPADHSRGELEDVTAARPSLADLDPEEVRRHAAVTTALRDHASERAVDALAVRCWPEFPTRLGVCPCSSLSRLADEGLPTQCERDVYGAATMLLLDALGAGTTYLVDTVDLDAPQNIVRLWHCGSAATALAADPDDATQFVHCNRKIGVAGNFPLKTGRVVMARLTEDLSRRGGLRLLVASGESVPAPNRFQGNTAAVRLDADATDFVHGLVTGGFPHHTVLAWADVRPQLRTAADLLDIPVIEW